ncbi:MAG: hypothetical protein IKF10_00240, partial [Lachnospiraceae bacterium]|nr:hypothetical protein [Lachnospiraceae bacterium]
MVDTSNKKVQIASNTVYTIAGALVLNGVLQLLVYPQLNARMGAEANGTVLYIMGLVSILGPSIGQALNNARLVMRRECEVKNGDYNTLLILFGAIGTAVALIISRNSIKGSFFYVMTAALIMITIFRYYGDVEYRLTLNYKKYFIYYLLISVGYAAGFAVYLMHGSWFLIFLIGEAAAFAYLLLTGSVYNKFFTRSEYFELAMKRGSILVLSYLVTNTSLNIDRLVLKNTLGGTAVTQYYVVSLIGKTLVLFIAPINTIIISYLTREKAALGRKRFLTFAGAGILVSFIFFLCCQIATPIFIRLFYPDLYESTRQLVTVVNISQILSMLSAYLFILVLTFTGEKWQLTLQTAHLIVLCLLIFITIGSGSLL